jgi:hypothetical protein
VLGDVGRRLLLLVAADLADEDDELGLRVGLELRDDVDGVKISAGMIPAFALPGERTPGQFGPIIVTSFFDRAYVYARSMSCAGMCSVMQITVWIPASMAS